MVPKAELSLLVGGVLRRRRDLELGVLSTVTDDASVSICSHPRVRGREGGHTRWRLASVALDICALTMSCQMSLSSLVSVATDTRGSVGAEKLGRGLVPEAPDVMLERWMSVVRPSEKFGWGHYLRSTAMVYTGVVTVSLEHLRCAEGTHDCQGRT